MSHAGGGEPLPELDSIPERLVFARRRGGFTQKEFALRLGIGVRTLQDYESGSTNIPAHLVPVVERLCDLPPGWILYDGSALDWENERRRRLPPGSSLLGLLVVVGALVFPAPSNALALRCHGCAPIRDSRQPRVKLATRNRRSPSGRGRLLDLDEPNGLGESGFDG